MKAQQPSSDRPLTPKQELFCREYVKDCNGARAWRDAGYQVKSMDVAAAAASRMLTDVRVQKRVQELIAARDKRLEITTDRIMLEVSRIAFSDPRRMFNADGTLKDVPALDDDTAAALASFETYEEFDGSGQNRRRVGVTRKTKLWNKVAALEKLMKNKGLLVDHVELTGKDGRPLQVETISDADRQAAIASVLQRYGLPATPPEARTGCDPAPGGGKADAP